MIGISECKTVDLDGIPCSINEVEIRNAAIRLRKEQEKAARELAAMGTREGAKAARFLGLVMNIK